MYKMSELKFVARDGTISIEAARVNAKMTLEQACKAVGVTKATLISYEKGRTSPTVETVRRMCDVYGIEFSKLSFLPQKTN